MLSNERHAWSTGALLIGIDEVGRGPLAGPVVAAAVVFPEGHKAIKGVRDSKLVKQLAERIELTALIRERALSWGLGAASVREIDRHNIRRATALAMRRAIARCRARLPEGVRVAVVIDGQQLPELGEPHVSIIKGDLSCHTIAAASLLAKVARDQIMVALAARRPGYGWESNVGYAAAAHIAGLRSLGLTPHHRVVFCRTAIGQEEMFETEAEDQ